MNLATLKSMTLAQQFTLLIGISFLLAGVGGFLPFVSPPVGSDAPALIVQNNYGYLVGLFPVNLLHNFFHLSMSLAAFWAFRHATSALIYCRVLAVILGILTVIGLIPQLQTMGGFVPVFGHAIWLHGLEALAGAYLGFIKK